MRVKLAARGGGPLAVVRAATARSSASPSPRSCRHSTCSSRAAWRTASSSSTSISAARFPTSASSRGRSPKRRACLRRAGEGGGRPPVPRRGRRPRRRLRRLADQLRVEHELHARGVRQRRRLPRAVGLRRGGRGAPDDRLGERTRGGGLPLRAGLQRARRLGFGDTKNVPRRRSTRTSSRISTSSRRSTR
jgi:hypothetical protein